VINVERVKKLEEMIEKYKKMIETGKKEKKEE